MVKVGTSERPDLPLAVVVGAGGMGMAVARRIGYGARLLLADRNAEHLDQQAAALRVEGHDVITQVCDVTSESDVAELGRVAKDSGPVRTLVNVVGLSPSMGDFRALIAVNLIGATRIADTFLEVVEPGACAIFISSIAAYMRSVSPALQAILDAPLEPGFIERLEAELDEPAVSSFAYLLSKSSLNRMCRRKATDWGARGARIVSLSPGLIATPMGALEFTRQPAKYDMLAATPITREGTMLEIANAVAFLASDGASFISGTDLVVDGGLTGTLRERGAATGA